MFSTTTHEALVGVGLVGLVILMWSFRRRQTWGAIFLWLVPFCFAIAATDRGLGWLAQRWPHLGVGEPGWGLRFTAGMFLTVPLFEVFYQRLVTIASGGGAFHVSERSGD